jgi:hypothetical protein
VAAANRSPVRSGLTAALLVALAVGPVWLLARTAHPASAGDGPFPAGRVTPGSAVVASLAAALPSDAPQDVTATRGCVAGDLPGFTLPRWVTVQSGFARTDGAAYLQCQINRWSDEDGARADFGQRTGLLDGVVSFTASRPPGQRTERIVTVNDGPDVRSYAERSPTAATRLTWISVTRHGRYAGVVTLHSYVDPAPVDLAAFEGLVALVLERMSR